MTVPKWTSTGRCEAAITRQLRRLVETSGKAGEGTPAPWSKTSLFAHSAILLAALLSLVAGRAPAKPAEKAGAESLAWLFAGPGVVAEIAADAQAARFLVGTEVFVMTGRAVSTIPPSWNVTICASFKSYADLKRRLDAGDLDPSVRAVLYDPEGWRFTPPDEQHTPARHMKMAADLAHAHGLLFIAAPAVNLVEILAPGESRGPFRRYETYLRLNLAADAARYADVIDIQAQGAEADAQIYGDFVRRAAAQARAANPKVRIFAGLSTQPGGRDVSAADVLRAIAASHAHVDGYWFNIPRPGELCPGCTGFRPEIALETLHRLQERGFEAPPSPR